MPSSPTPARAPVAVVTGGRRGIGRACATALAGAGFDVVVLDLVEDADAAETLAAIRVLGRRAAFVAGDIAEIERRQALVDALVAAFGAIDCLVNNAGVFATTRGADLLDVTPESYDRVMGVNLRGTFFLTQEVARRMVAESDARRPRDRSIITVTSGVVGRPRTDLPEYSFSKTGLALMSQAFALRLGRHGIRTFEIRPGVTRSEMSRDAWGIYEKLIAEGRFPIARIGLPEDVGAAVAMFAAGTLPYSTGGHLYLDGGFHIPTPVLPRADGPRS
jgi:NAD(P)-dependent dehydrogenase (short-subunit alcohol dehydrogenase family)